MKKIICFIMAFCCVFVTGCGCGKNEKKLNCTSEFDEYGEKVEVVAIFKNDILSSQQIRNVKSFDDEVFAQRYYEMYKDDENFEVELDGTNVVTIQKVENSSENEIFQFDTFKQNMIDNGFTCDIK